MKKSLINFNHIDCSQVKCVIFFLGFVLLYHASFAQVGENEIDGTVIAGSVDNQIVISIYNPAVKDSISSVTMDTLKSGRWIKNVRIRPDTLGPLAAGSTENFTVLFDIAAEAEENALDSFVLIATAGGVLLDHPRQAVIVRIAEREESAVIAYPLKEDAPPVYTIRDDTAIFQYCATDVREINEYDDVAIFFTPKRVLSGPQPENLIIGLSIPMVLLLHTEAMLLNQPQQAKPTMARKCLARTHREDL